MANTQNDIISVLSVISPKKDYRETLWRKHYAQTQFSFQSWVLYVVNYLLKQLFIAFPCSNNENITVLNVLTHTVVLDNPNSVRILSKILVSIFKPFETDTDIVGCHIPLLIFA